MKSSTNELVQAEKLVQKSKSRIQNGIGFIQKLLIAHWRQLVLLLIGVYLPLQIFEVLAVKIWQNGNAFPWDVSILTAIHQTAQQSTDVLAVTLTKFGSYHRLLPLFAFIGLVLLLQKKWRLCGYLVTTATGSAIINRTAKAFMHRVRPQLWDSSAPEFDFAFPSGHSMTSMTLVIVLLVLTWKTKWRLPVFILGSLYVLAIGWTRLYLGVHFPSDILAGWMVSLAWGIGVCLLIRPHWNATQLVKDGIVSVTSIKN